MKNDRFSCQFPFFLFFYRITEQIRRHKEDFARVAPYLIESILGSFQRVTIYPEVKANLLSAAHKLLDICDKHSKDFLASNLPEGARELFRQTLDNYNQYHRYTGRV